MAKNSSRRLTEQDRAERRRQNRERLYHPAERLLTSEGWQRWVRVRSLAALGRLSISNQLLVAWARPDATFVAGFKAWLRLGYAVRKGERAIAIIAPLPVKDRNKLTGADARRRCCSRRCSCSTRYLVFRVNASLALANGVAATLAGVVLFFRLLERSRATRARSWREG